MAIIAQDNGGGDYQRVPQGTHAAICYMVVDLGKQRTEWQGVERVQHKIYVRWELPDERMEVDGRSVPMSIGKRYTLSLGEKANLRADLESWRGRAFTPEELKGFDVSKLLGVGCFVSVTHDERNGKTYENVASVQALPKSYPRPERTENAHVLFDDEHRQNYDALPAWLQKLVDEQVRDAPKAAAAGAGYDDIDDAPF